MSYQYKQIRQYRQCQHQHQHQIRQSLKSQQGVVIVMALFIVALVAAMSYMMMFHLQRDTLRTTLILRNVEAEFYAQGSIAWAIDVLRTNLEKQKQNQQSKQPVDVMPTQSPIDNVNGTRITSTIYDMQMRFNLNTLAKPENQPDFKRLILAVYPNFTDAKAQEVARALNDWLSAKGNVQSEFDRYYLESIPPYRAAHKLMTSSSELRLVKGVTPALMIALRPYVTALPTDALINANTATAPVLMTLNPNLTLETAKALQSILMRTPVTSKEAFSSLDIVKNNNISTDKLTFMSTYFLVETTVSIEDQVLLLYTLLERSEKEGKPVLRIVWQSKGIW